LSTPDLEILPGITLDENEPVFSEPWEAQAFALVIQLHEKKVFTWLQWAEVLSETIKQDDGCTPYYELWLVALEKIITENALLSAEEVKNREKDWQAALLATPHGTPIELSAGQDH